MMVVAGVADDTACAFRCLCKSTCTRTCVPRPGARPAAAAAVRGAPCRAHRRTHISSVDPERMHRRRGAGTLLILSQSHAMAAACMRPPAVMALPMTTKGTRPPHIISVSFLFLLRCSSMLQLDAIHAMQGSAALCARRVRQDALRDQVRADHSQRYTVAGARGGAHKVQAAHFAVHLAGPEHRELVEAMGEAKHCTVLYPIPAQSHSRAAPRTTKFERVSTRAGVRVCAVSHSTRSAARTEGPRALRLCLLVHAHGHARTHAQLTAPSTAAGQ